jgi:hypothetical protein
MLKEQTNLPAKSLFKDTKTQNLVKISTNSLRLALNNILVDDQQLKTPLTDVTPSTCMQRSASQSIEI